MTQDRRVGGAVVRVPNWVRWAVAVALGAAFVLWLILFAPRLLVPAVSQADLRDVPDAAKWGSSPASVGLVEVAVCACPWPDSVRWESAREGE
jgi:hypothetical protein